MEDDAFGRCYVACMNRCADDCRRDPAAYMPWRPGGCTTECDELYMEDDAFGRCCVACMNRCADGCRRAPRYALAPRGHGVRRGSASPSAGPPTSHGAGRLGIAPSLFYLSNHPLLSARRTPYVESMRRAPPRRVQARRHRHGAGRLGIAPSFSPTSARRTPALSRGEGEAPKKSNQRRQGPIKGKKGNYSGETPDRVPKFLVSSFRRP